MKILILDEQGLFLDAVSLFLIKVEPQIEILTASTLETGFDCLRKHADIGLILVNINDVGHEGVKTITRIKSMAPEIPVGVIASPLPYEMVQEAMRLGAIGYFPKNMRAEAFVQALRYALTGECFVPFVSTGVDTAPAYYKKSSHVSDSYTQEAFSMQRSAQKIRIPSNGLPSTEDLAKLSGREIQTLKKLGEGLSNKLIADALGVKEVTIKQHMRSILSKLHLTNRTQAALVAHELNL